MNEKDLMNCKCIHLRNRSNNKIVEIHAIENAHGFQTCNDVWYSKTNWVECD